MKIPKITTSIKVERYSWIRRGRESYGYCEDKGDYQILIKRWKLGGIIIWTKILDREEIPGYVLIELGALGSTEWKSRFSSYINQQNNRKESHT